MFISCTSTVTFLLFVMMIIFMHTNVLIIIFIHTNVFVQNEFSNLCFGGRLPTCHSCAQYSGDIQWPSKQCCHLVINMICIVCDGKADRQ